MGWFYHHPYGVGGLYVDGVVVRGAMTNHRNRSMEGGARERGGAGRGGRETREIPYCFHVDIIMIQSSTRRKRGQARSDAIWAARHVGRAGVTL